MTPLLCNICKWKKTPYFGDGLYTFFKHSNAGYKLNNLFENIVKIVYN